MSVELFILWLVNLFYILRKCLLTYLEPGTTITVVALSGIVTGLVIGVIVCVGSKSLFAKYNFKENNAEI